MSQALPISSFAFCNDAEKRNLKNNVTQIPDDADEGYILEVDLEYPAHLHQKHNDFPLCAENIAIPNEMLSEYSRQLKEALGMKAAGNKKLIQSLYPKRRYTIHYRYLKCCLKQGMVLTTVHRAIKFRQSKWLEPYINHNTRLRAAAENEFEKSLFKLFNNR